MVYLEWSMPIMQEKCVLKRGKRWLIVTLELTSRRWFQFSRWIKLLQYASILYVNLNLSSLKAGNLIRATPLWRISLIKQLYLHLESKT